MEASVFFKSLQGLTPDQAVKDCKARQAAWTMKRTLLESARMNLKRSEKAEAGRLTTEIIVVNGWLRELVNVRRHYQHLCDREQTHSLWSEAVMAVGGPKVLKDVQAFMKRRRKELAAAQQATLFDAADTQTYHEAPALQEATA